MLASGLLNTCKGEQDKLCMLYCCYTCYIAAEHFTFNFFPPLPQTAASWCPPTSHHYQTLQRKLIKGSLSQFPQEQLQNLCIFQDKLAGYSKEQQER